MKTNDTKQTSLKTIEKDIAKEISDQLEYIENKDKKIKVRLASFLQEPDDRTGEIRIERFIKKAYSRAVDDGDVNAMRLVWSYSDGLPRQEIVMEDNSNKPRFVIGKVEINKKEQQERADVVEGEVVGNE